jgi:hypothetical protein
MTMFWDSEGLNFSKKTTISDKYCEAIKRKRPGQLTAEAMLLHDGAHHASAQTAAWIQKRKREVLQHPHSASNFAPSDFHLFGTFQNFLLGKRFEDQNTLQKTVLQYFTSLGKEHYCDGMFKLVNWCNKYIFYLD